MRAGGSLARERVSLAMVSVAILALALCARAQPGVFFEPGQVMVQPDEVFEMSFRVGACEDSIASFQLYMSFDPEIVELVEATEGTLYAECGTMTWFIDDEIEPGFWHFFNTPFGAGTYVEPPGELLHLELRALAGGYTQAHIDTIRMTDVRRNALEVESFEHGEILVAGTGVPDGEAAADALALERPRPNPFVTETVIGMNLAADLGPVRAEIYDLAGRLVRSIDVPRREGRCELRWDGRADDGSEAPSSVYFLRVTGAGSEARVKLVKMR